MQNLAQTSATYDFAFRELAGTPLLGFARYSNLPSGPDLQRGITFQR